MKGIMFTEPLFKAIIAGKKSQTRRIVKHPDYDFLGSSRPIIDTDGVSVIFWEGSIACVVHPHYYPGETVYLKEPYYDASDGDLFFKYDFHGKDNIPVNFEFYDNPKWKNKMFMSEKFARYYIKITNVRVELLMNITEEDARKEGCKIFGITLYNNSGVAVQTIIRGDAKKDFENLWDSINVKWNRRHDDYRGYTFEDNPFVWVYEFELVNYPRP